MRNSKFEVKAKKELEGLVASGLLGRGRGGGGESAAGGESAGFAGTHVPHDGGAGVAGGAGAGAGEGEDGNRGD